MTDLRTAAKTLIDLQDMDRLEINKTFGHRDDWLIACRVARDALRAALAEQCKCGDRTADQCPGEWEPGCDLGANEGHAVVHEPQDEPVAWLTPRTRDSYARPDLGYETASEADYGAFPVYTRNLKKMKV